MNKTNKKSILYTIIIVMVAVIIGELVCAALNDKFNECVEYILKGVGRVFMIALSCIGMYSLVIFIRKKDE
jgi:choline-glycine betaine transporter